MTLQAMKINVPKGDSAYSLLSVKKRFNKQKITKAKNNTINLVKSNSNVIVINLILITNNVKHINIKYLKFM